MGLTYKSYSVLHGLHRPYHRPLWIVKWVCVFFAKRRKQPHHYFYVDDVVADFYFVLLDWLYKRYPNDSDGLPSVEAIQSVYNHFKEKAAADRYSYLKFVLAKESREDIEKQIYSTYKAAGYYINLAKEKLHFVDGEGNVQLWPMSAIMAGKKTSGISNSDRRIYLRQILHYDAHFFLALCLLYRDSIKYNLKHDEIVFEFMQQYYPLPRFDYVHSSHQNYFEVRKHWAELLGAVSKVGSLSVVVKECIIEDACIFSEYNDIVSNIQKYRTTLRAKNKFLKQKNVFLKEYKKHTLKQGKSDAYVNLYDLCAAMGMSYNTFSKFLERFYEEERMKCGIFFINIVSTIDQRKRFYVRNTPVLKIKIS